MCATGIELSINGKQYFMYQETYKMIEPTKNLMADNTHLLCKHEMGRN